MNYVLSLAWDEGRQSIYTLALPNRPSPRVVISRFDRRDMTLSEEFLPTIGESSGLTVRKDRALDEYTVTAATVHDERLYALSAAYSTLLAIDPATHAIIAAYGLGGVERPVGIAFKGPALHVLDAGGRTWTGEIR